MRISVLINEGVFDSGLAAVCDVIETANYLRHELPDAPQAWDLSIIGAKPQVRTARGLVVQTVPADEVEPDILLVPALGFRESRELVEGLASAVVRTNVEVVVGRAASGTHIAAACTGTFLLGEAGVLDGHRATTTWWLEPTFRERYPRVDLDAGATVLADRLVTTAGAAFAHIDLALSLVAIHSPALAQLVARFLVIGQRSSQAGYAIPAVLARSSPELTAFEQWVRKHLSEPLRIGEVAQAIGVSERTLQRLTATTIGMTPAEFLSEVRIDEAAHLLRTTTLSIDDVTQRVGFQNAATLRALIRRRRGLTLGEFRKRDH